MNAESLRMPKEEFEAYTSSSKIAPNRIKKKVSAIKSVENSIRQVEQLNEAQELLKARADQLSTSIERSVLFFKSWV